MHPGDPLTTAVWRAHLGFRGFHMRLSGPLNMAVRCMWCARLVLGGPSYSVSWWPLTAVAWGAHLGSIGSLIVYFGDPLNTVVRHGGLLLRIAFPECGVPAWAPGELL